ncbi:MAG TPA: M23 family metallopeptidase [Gaiellaceae bacterium]|nr:M23 family metallopeptidase [Gaiellaceae bacterium]
MVEIYESNDPSTLDVVLGSANLQDALLDKVEYLNEISARDRSVAAQMRYVKLRVTAARQKTKALRGSVLAETAVIRARTQQTRTVWDALVGARNDLDASRQSTITDLSKLTASERAEAGEIDALQAESAQLAARIRAAQYHDSGAPTQTPSFAVACGEHVDQGQVIGYVGCTGHCTGPHLHFEVRVDGDPVDPLGYL